jgi:hypothetical protein
MKQFAEVATNGHGGPPVAGGLRAKATSLGWNQSPSNWAGTGPPGGGDGDITAAGVGLGPREGVCFAEEFDWPHDEAIRTIAMANRLVIAGEPTLRLAVMRVLRMDVKLGIGGLECKRKNT